MKLNVILLLTFWNSFSLIFSQSLIDFESSSNGDLQIVSNNITFEVNGDLTIDHNTFGLGLDASEGYLDNFSDCNSPSNGSFYSLNKDPFILHYLWVYVADCNDFIGDGANTNINISVYRSGTLIKDSTVTVYSGPGNGNNNGYDFVDFRSASFSCMEIDSIKFTTNNTDNYFAIDNISWSLPSEITPSISNVVIDGGINNECPGATTINLTATASHNDFDTLKWYGNAAGTGTLLGTGLTLSNQIPDSTTTYYAIINGLCGTNVSDQVTYTTKDTAAVTSITSNKDNICSVDSVELTATVNLGDNGSFEWFDQPEGQGTALGTDLTITQTPGSTKKYYAYIASTCNNAQDSIEVTVDPSKTVSTLTDITSDDNDICDGTQITLTANGVTLGTGATGNWYPQANGQGDAISSNTNIDTIPLVTNKYFYYISGECNTIQDSIEVTVLNTDTTVTNDGSTLTSAATGVDYLWLNCADNSSTGVTTQSFTPSESGDYKVEITNVTCIDTSRCNNITITSINGQLSQLGVVLYPNPTQDIVKIGLEGSFTVTVLHANGTQAFTSSNSNQIDMSDLSSGIYFVEITKNELTETFKIIKE